MSAAPKPVAPCGHNPLAADSMPDESIVAALARVGATDAMVCALGEAQDSAGYGMDTRPTTFAERAGLATVIVSNCEEAASGFTTWAQIIEDDVLDGAPRSGATRFNGHLEREFCPGLTLPEPAAPEVVELTSGLEDEHGLSGFGSTLAWVSGRFEPLALSECTSRVGTLFFDDGQAYRLGDDAILCSDHDKPEQQLWSPAVGFTSAQGEDDALDIVRTILPADTVEVSRKRGTSSVGPGSCLSVDYQSEALAARQKTSGGRVSDPGFVNVHLYPDRRTSNGSSAGYSGTANIAHISESRDNEEAVPVC